MTYQALARKYRPKNFSDLIGQESVSKALSNAIRLKREPSAVLLAGVRGIGKTTTARIYAKALNCIQGPTPEPCGICENCEAIAKGTHEDVLEIDGASNNGVDEVRALKETIHYLPQRSKYKVYIIDEVHMLSGSAFNALLKTLEEPPRAVVFIFATTELHKVPKTVAGRCQTFHLKKISLNEVSERIAFILKQEKIDFDPDILFPLARQGQGSMRDALTYLDQVIALSSGYIGRKEIDLLRQGLDFNSYLEIVELLLKRDSETLLQKIELLEEQGLDYGKLSEELAALCRHGFVLDNIKENEQKLLDLAHTEIAALRKLTKTADHLDFNRLFRNFAQCRKELDGSTMDRFTFENYCLEWCLDPGLPKIADLLKLDAAKSAPTEAAVKAVPTSLRPQPTNSTRSFFPESWPELTAFWRQKKPIEGRILEELHVLEYGPQKIRVSVDPRGIAASLLQSQELQRVRKLFIEWFNFSGELIVTEATKIGNAHLPPENLRQKKEREELVRHEENKLEAINHPLPQALMAQFRGTVKQIELK